MMYHLPFVWYVKLGTKITASVEREFRLRSCSEDDTILSELRCTSSEYIYRLSVGSTGAVIFYVKQKVLPQRETPSGLN